MSTHAEVFPPLDEPEAPPAAARPRRRPPRAALVAGVLLAAGAAYYFWPTHGSAPASYVTAPVDRGKIEQSVNSTGAVNPVTTVQVGTYVSGPIQAIDVTFNSPVRKGQRIAKIDPAPFAVKVREAAASVQNAKAKVGGDQADLKLKKLLLERNRVLLGRNLVAQNDVDTAETVHEQAVAQLALDQAAVAQAQANLDEAQVNLAYTDIVSPVDGVVVSVSVSVGQTVAASFQTPTLFLIAGDLTKMQVDTNVSESDVGRVKEGQHASFTVDAYPGQPFRGKIAQVRNAPITVQNVVTYDVVIAVDNPELELKPGMTANVSITTAKRDDVLRIPVRALRFRPEGAQSAEGKKPKTEKKDKKEKKAEKAEKEKKKKDKMEENTVYALAPDGTLRRVEVEIGIRDSQHAEVLSGDLHEGDEIVTGQQREGTAEADASSQRPPGFHGLKRL
jgi:HlyD family secretion protein